jgi:hypothetical protein
LWIGAWVVALPAPDGRGYARPPMEDGFDAWVGELRVDSAIRARSRAGWLQRQSDEEATLLGVLVELGQRGRPVLIDVCTGRRHRATIESVGSDYLAVRTATDARHLVAVAAVVSVRPLPGEAPVGGEQPSGPRGALADAMASLLGTGIVVALWPRTGEPLRGAVVSAGPDVIGLDLDAGGGVAYVALASLAEVSVAESG